MTVNRDAEMNASLEANQPEGIGTDLSSQPVVRYFQTLLTTPTTKAEQTQRIVGLGVFITALVGLAIVARWLFK